MFKILVPSDFSTTASNAMAYAAQMAKAFHSKLILLHVVEPVGGDATMFVDEDILDEEISEAEARLKRLIRAIKGIEDPFKEAKVTRGFPITKILDTVEKENIPLVVMGTDGTKNRIQDFLGSNTYKVVKNALCAVLTVPKNSPPFHIKKIAIAAALHKNENDQLLTIIKHIARHFQSEIILLHVENKDNPPKDIKGESICWLTEQLQEFPVTYKELFSDRVADSIIKYSMNNAIDLLALSPEKHDLFYLLMKGSTTRQLVLHSQIPLLTIQADGN